MKVTGTLVGLWEGIVLQHFLQKWPKSFDPYIAYAVRMFVDFLVTESVARMLLVLLWTGLGMILADIAPGVWKDAGMRRIWSRFKRDMRVISRRIPKMAIPIPFMYKQRTVRFLPSRASSEATTSVVSGRTNTVVSATTTPTATIRSTPRYAATPAPSSSQSVTSTTSSSASAAVLSPPTVSLLPPTPGMTLRKTRVPGHFMRDSETETEVHSTVAGPSRRPRIPSAETESESGLTTDNELLGTSRGSRYSLFPSRREVDLRLTESDTDDDTSSTTTETPDAGTLRDISIEAIQTTPTQSQMHLPIVPADPAAILILDASAPKTPLPPADQVPDIPDVDDAALDASWEKVERVDKVQMETKGKGKEPERLAEEKTEVIVKELTPEPANPDEKQNPELMIPPRVPPKDTEKVEKAMSEPGWLDEFLGKKKGKGKGKSRSVVSTTSTTEPFVKPGPSPLSRERTPTPPPAPKPGDLPPSLKQIFDVVPTPSAAADGTNDHERSPPPTFSQIYPDGVPDLLLDDSPVKKDTAAGKETLAALEGNTSAPVQDTHAKLMTADPAVTGPIAEPATLPDLTTTPLIPDLTTTPLIREPTSAPLIADMTITPPAVEPTTTPPIVDPAIIPPVADSTTTPPISTPPAETEPAEDSDTDSDVATILIAPPSKRLSASLELQNQISGLKKKLNRLERELKNLLDGGDAELSTKKQEEVGQAKQQIRKLEKKSNKISAGMLFSIPDALKG